MQAVLDFLLEYYIWVLAVLLILLITVIGFLADTKKKKKLREKTMGEDNSKIDNTTNSVTNDLNTNLNQSINMGINNPVNSFEQNPNQVENNMFEPSMSGGLNNNMTPQNMSMDLNNNIGSQNMNMGLNNNISSQNVNMGLNNSISSQNLNMANGNNEFQNVNVDMGISGLSNLSNNDFMGQTNNDINFNSDFNNYNNFSSGIDNGNTFFTSTSDQKPIIEPTVVTPTPVVEPVPVVPAGTTGPVIPTPVNVQPVSPVQPSAVTMQSFVSEPSVATSGYMSGITTTSPIGIVNGPVSNPVPSTPVQPSVNTTYSQDNVVPGFIPNNNVQQQTIPNTIPNSNVGTQSLNSGFVQGNYSFTNDMQNNYNGQINNIQ